MDFDLSGEQLLLRETAERFAASATEPLWAGLAELGLLGLPYGEADGGFGGGPIETMIVMEAFGKNNVNAPFVAEAILAGGVLREASPGHALIPSLIDGGARLALAHTEATSRYERHDVRTRAVPDGDGWRIDGAKSLVLAGDTATHLIVSARIDGARRDIDGIALFLLPGNAPGLLVRPYPTQDGLGAADVSLEDVHATTADRLDGNAADALDLAIDAATASVCAEAVGAMAALQEMTVDYLKQRRQFGVAIGSFQALQHRAVDMLIAVEQARSMAHYAAMMMSDPSPTSRATAVAGAKVQINRSARLVAQAAVQLHGGIAMTADYPAGAYVRRLTMIERQFGDTAHLLRVVAAAGGLEVA